MSPGKELCDLFEEEYDLHLGVADRVQILSIARKYNFSFDDAGRLDVFLAYLPFLIESHNYVSKQLAESIEWLNISAKITAESYLARYRNGEFSNGKWPRNCPWP